MPPVLVLWPRPRPSAPPSSCSCPRAGGTARAWWPWNRRVGRDNGTAGDLEKALLVNETESTPTAKETQEHHKGATAQREEDKGGQLEEAACLGKGLNEAVADKTSGTQGYALHGSLSLLPGFGPEGLLKNFSVNGKWWFTVLFCSWWSTVAMGVLSSLFPWTRFDIGVAHLTIRIAIIGINIVVVLYTCWLLGTCTPGMLGLLLSFVLLGHLVFAAWQYYCGRRRTRERSHT